VEKEMPQDATQWPHGLIGLHRRAWQAVKIGLKSQCKGFGPISLLDLLKGIL
jgi:hypothetical protein